MSGKGKGKKSIPRWFKDEQAIRDSTGMSTENHMQMFARLVKAGSIGIHNPPGPRKPRKSS